MTGETNQILKFNLKAESFLSLVTQGSAPKPREDCGCAKQGTQVYIHGGQTKSNLLRDFFMLDLQTNLWTELKEFGFSRPNAYHTLTFISQKQIMLLGGAEEYSGKGASDLVMLYNTTTSTWTESQGLPLDFYSKGIGFYGKGTGLSSHKVVAVRKGKRVSKVICLGGHVGREYFSSNLLEFQIKT